MISLNSLTFLKLLHFFSETHVRLTGHNSTFAGRVEVFSHGVWGRVITYWPYWSKKEANIVCTQLGFPGAITAVSYSAFGEGSGPVVMSRVRCLGTEKTLQQCSYNDFVNSNLLPGHEVGVVCKTFQFSSENNDILIRLQGSTLPYTGRVKVLYAGVWGAISSSNWDINDANVVCRQLGYSAGAQAALTNGFYGLVSGPVWITNLQCTGSESNVMECAHDGLGNKTERQSKENTASVICKDSSFSNVMVIRLCGSNSSNMGRVEMHYAGKWGSVYASGWDIKDATVACRQLGYHSATLAFYSLFCSADIPVWFTNFRCKGNETSLEQCAREFYKYSPSSYCANVACTVADEGPELRLRGSPVPHAGRVEIRFKGVWGTINYYWWFYHEGLSPRATRVICRQLGFADGVISVGYSVYGPGVGPQWLDSHDLNGCLGSESNILNCSYSSPRFRAYDHHSDASVVCKPNATQASAFQVRLNGSSLSFAGTINVLYFGVWGGILGFNVDIRVGHVICRQLGYYGAEQIFRNPAYGVVKGPIWIWSIQCSGNETKISQCRVETWDKIWRSSSYYLSYYQRPRYAASLLCNESNSTLSEVLNVRLAGTAISNAGRVEVLYAGLWGTIGGWNWDINDAHVVCRQLGYPGAISSGSGNQFGIGTGPMWFENARCLGNESSFEECSKSTLGYPNGYYSSVATALCKLKRQSVLNVRLAGASISNAGRVEVLYAGLWGTISGSQWDINDAHVVCRQLGYPGAISSGSSNQFGIGTGPMWFGNARCLGNESSFEECSKSTFGYPNGYYSSVATALCKLKRQSETSRNCSTMTCSDKGTCINTAFSPVCNCTEGYMGLNCEIRTLDQCKSFPCQNGGECFSNGSLYLCMCPRELTGKHFNEKIAEASNPCQSNPCPNNTSCYHNDTRFTCISHAEEDSNKTNAKPSSTNKKAASNTYFIVGLSVAVLLVFVFAAVIGCLVFKIRRLTKNQPNHQRAVFSNLAYRADSERKLDDMPTNDVDLGMVAIRGGTNPKSSIYENPCRPLPPVPQRNSTRSGAPSSAARQTNGGYSSGTNTTQAERLYMGLTTTNGNNTKPLAAEPSSYMSLTPERPETGSYSTLTAARSQVPRKAQRGIGKRK